MALAEVNRLVHQPGLGGRTVLSAAPDFPSSNCLPARPGPNAPALLRPACSIAWGAQRCTCLCTSTTPPSPSALQANWLKAQGVRRGDFVALYMPMILELPYAMVRTDLVRILSSYFVDF